MQKRAAPRKPAASRKTAPVQQQKQRNLATSRALRHTPSAKPSGPKAAPKQSKAPVVQHRRFQTQTRQIPVTIRTRPQQQQQQQRAAKSFSYTQRTFTPPKFVPQQQHRSLSTIAQLKAKFASLPAVSSSSLLAKFTPSDAQNASMMLLTNSARNISTTSHTPASIRRFTKNMTPISIPHHSNIASSELDSTPFFVPLRAMAMQKAKDSGKKAEKKGFQEVDPAEEAFNSAGDVKKNLRNWLEHILQSKPDVHEMPEAAQKNEELFVKECQMRFAQRLDKRSRYEQAKIILKQRAMEQLPGELKDSALKEDPTLWSMRIMTPFSDPPRKRWLHEHYGIPYKVSQQEIDDEDFIKKRYARL